MPDEKRTNLAAQGGGGYTTQATWPIFGSTCVFSIIHGQLLISLKEIVQKEMVSMFVIGERYGQESESNCTNNPGNPVDNFIIIILINLDIML